MTNTEKAERGRLIFGLLSALFGIAGFAFESWALTGVALGFAMAWLIVCIVTVNRWIDDETGRIAPRHRKEDQ